MSDEHDTDASATKHRDISSYVSNIVAYVDCSVGDGGNSIRDMTCHRMDRGESYHPCFGNIQAAVDYLIRHDDEDVDGGVGNDNGGGKHNNNVGDPSFVRYGTVQILAPPEDDSFAAAVEGYDGTCSGKGNYNVETSKGSGHSGISKTERVVYISIEGERPSDDYQDVPAVVIDCNFSGRAFNLTPTPNVRYSARIVNFEDLLITNCSPNGSDLLNSGGAIIASVKSLEEPYHDGNIERAHALTFRRVTFYQNYANENGGAIALLAAVSYSSERDVNEPQTNPLVSFVDCYFHENAVDGMGGAIFMGGSSANENRRIRAVFQNCSFDGNSASNGGAIYSFIEQGGFYDTYSDCQFSNNVAKAKGGALDYVSSAKSKVGRDEETKQADSFSAAFHKSNFIRNVAFGSKTSQYFTANNEFTPLSVQGGAGGAIYACNSGLFIDSCEFVGNEVSDHGMVANDDTIGDDYLNPATIVEGARGGAICMSNFETLTKSVDAVPAQNSLIVNNSTFVSNTVKSNGIIPTNMFHSAAGGALWLEVSPSLKSLVTQDNIRIKNSRFRLNEAAINGDNFDSGEGSTTGGAIHFHKRGDKSVAKASIDNVLFDSNSARDGGNGGAMSAEGRGLELVVENCSFVSNIAQSSSEKKGLGGALSLTQDAKGTIIQSKFVANIASPYLDEYKDVSKNNDYFPYVKKNFSDAHTTSPISEEQSGSGGALYSSDASLLVSETSFLRNKCISGGGDTGGCEGGAIYIGKPFVSQHGKVESMVETSTFALNSAIGANPSFSNGIIRNPNSGKGGAVFIRSAQPTFDSCDFSSNVATAGLGGMFASGGAVDIVLGADFDEGGLIKSSSSGVYFSSCIFEDNKVGDVAPFNSTLTKLRKEEGTVYSKSGRGGAINVIMSKVSFLNSTFSKNVAVASDDSSLPSFAGALFLDEMSESSIRESSLSGNAAVRGIGSDIVSIDASSSHEENTLLPTKKLYIESTNFSTNYQGEESLSIREIFYNEDLIDISIVCLGGKIDIGPQNFFNGNFILLAGPGSTIGESIVGKTDVELRKASLSLSKRSTTENLGLLAWNASITFNEDTDGFFDTQNHTVGNIAVVGGSIFSKNDIIVVNEAAFVEGTIECRNDIVDCSFQVFGNFYSGLTRSMIRQKSWFPDRLVADINFKKIILRIHGVLVANGSTIYLDRDSSIHISDKGSMAIDSSTKVEKLRNISDAVSTAMRNDGMIYHTACQGQTLEISGGMFNQSLNGEIIVSVPTEFTETPFIMEQIDIVGTIDIDVCEHAVLNENSSWTFLSSEYDGLVNSSAVVVQFSPIIQMPEGVRFNVTEDFNVNRIFRETLFISPGGITCESVLRYSANVDSHDSCDICLSSSSGCTWQSDSSICVTPSQSYERDERSCCPDSCNKRGTCIWSTGHCSCGWFYDGDSCAEISDIAVTLIACLTGFFLIILITIVYWKFNRRTRKLAVSDTLEELRRELLIADEMSEDDIESHSVNHRDKGASQKHSKYLSKGFIADIQQQLFLKDVSVSPGEVSMERQIGDGAFGDVYVGKYRETTVAVKVIRPNMLLGMSQEEVDCFKKEAYIMSRLRHPNIALFMGIVSVSDPLSDAGFESLYILSEYMEKGSLLDIIEQVNSQETSPFTNDGYIDWSFERILMCALQAALGMSYLHSHNPPICHRDLKSSNLLVDSRWVVKVADFGVSRVMTETSAEGSSQTLEQNADESFLKTTLVGTVAWAAPEMLVSQAKANYTLKVDQYSFGMVLYELWERQRPFSELTSRFAIMDAVRAGERPVIAREGCSKNYMHLMDLCLQEDPIARPNFSEIVRVLKEELSALDTF